MTAFELCGEYNDQTFKVKRGSVVWESIQYCGNVDKCRISRVVETGGKSWFLGLRYKSRYIDPDTEIIVTNKEN